MSARALNGAVVQVPNLPSRDALNHGAAFLPDAVRSCDVSPRVWLTAKQAAEHLQIGTKLLYAEVKRGRIRAAAIGGGRNLRFRREWLDAYGDAMAEPVEIVRLRA